MDKLEPELFLDLKTGAAGLDPTWYKKLQNPLPPKFRTVPAIALRC
ncbi:hypothetical protein [Krasilnikovia sp. MM14-A1259]